MTHATIKNALRALAPAALAAILAGCSSLQSLGDQLNSLGNSVHQYVDAHSSTEVVYRAPDVTKNALFVLGSTWSQLNSHLEAVRDKQTGALSYQAVVAVTYNLQGQFKQVRHYQWANVEISTVPALQRLWIQDEPDVPVLASALSDCGGVCRVETVTVGLDETLLKSATHDLLVQVHAGRDGSKFPQHPAIATFKPDYVASFLRAAASKRTVASSKE